MTELNDITKNILPASVRIAVVDDHSLFRAGIVSLLKDYEDFNVVLEASDGKELLSRLTELNPQVILLDIEMPGMNGVETALYLREKHPAIKIIILTIHNEEGFIFDMMNKGVHGFLPKDKSVDELVKAIHSVMSEGIYYNEQIRSAMTNGAEGQLKSLELPSIILNEKEIEIVKLICRQKTNKEIGEIMGISVRTIENYRATILSKTKTKNTAGLVLYALKHKMLSDFAAI